VAQSIYGSPVVWTGDGSPRLYIWGTGDVLKEYVLSGGKFDETPAAMGPVETLSDYSQDPAGILSVSSNGSETGTGIVWGVKPLLDPDHLTVAGTFYAFDALTLQELWSSDDDPGRDGFGDYAKFVPPTVANGKVYLATHSKQVVVYGLLAGAGGGA
jgi:outer membrane protein assembly factor BamB